VREDVSVDVIQPTCRRARTIGCSIRSVLAQTFGSFRLHVVCDGCEPATEEAVAEAAGGDPRVSFHRFPKGFGLGYAHRNTVLRATAAPYVAYVSDDDLWFPDHLQRALEALRDNGGGLAAFRSCPVRPPGTLDPFFFAFDWRGRLGRELRRWFIGAPYYVHERRVFETVGYWNETLPRFGDREFLHRVLRSGLPFRLLDEVTVLRFYAAEWDAVYPILADPPQPVFLELLRDPAWREQVRRAARPGPRTLRVRARQWRDLLGFAWRSGPRFARYLARRARRR
jgi:glycosyltransferase involved in cell wall biosynthesis